MARLAVVVLVAFVACWAPWLGSWSDFQVHFFPAFIFKTTAEECSSLAAVKPPVRASLAM